ncbi:MULTISPECIES: hypothetical protein [Sphingomonas]|uniref:Uncharacterized protein n=1 Tax=Sphingomonas molluscorum TaxID=418184 RepID=A0ABU8Q4W9_9SPHN|nr:hypothetical protein [Sphingomonas sp. JUb134]MBM7406233.1 hypothetical protein [Sphingomonas sp. JUb134]
MSGGEWEVAEIGRLLHTHRLDAGLACSSLGINADEAERLVAAGEIVSSGEGLAERSAFLLNVLIRLELRCGHDSRAIAAAIERPVAELGGVSIGEALRRPIDVAGLRQPRCVAGTLPLPKVKMWRVADTYS